MDLKEIQKKYEIEYPKTYQKLNDKGMLDWGVFGKDWLKSEFPRLKKAPPLLLYANEFEIIDFESIDNEIAAIKDPQDYRQANPKFKFIPFAQNGAGDLYCFQFDEVQSGHVPIVLVWHDMNLVNVLAKNIEDFIFRSMLETLVDFEKMSSLLADGDINQNLERYLQTHAAFMTQQQNRIVESWYGKVISEKNKLDIVFLEEDIQKITGEMEEIIKFDRLNKEFEYQLEKPPIKETEQNKRRVGTLRLELSPVPLPNDKILVLLKALNWRKNKTNNSDVLVYIRRNAVIFGIPSMQTVGDTYQEKLMTLKEKCPNNMTLSFTEDDASKIYDL